MLVCLNVPCKYQVLCSQSDFADTLIKLNDLCYECKIFMFLVCQTSEILAFIDDLYGN